MKNSPSKKAARIAETAKKSGGMFVFATRDQKLIDAENTSAVLSKFKYTQHACKDCGHEFQAVAASGMQYFCVSCGSGKTEAKVDTAAKLELPADDKLTLVTCASCNTHNILPGSVVASVSQLACTACGHEMNYKTSEKADADEMPMNDMDPITDMDDMDLVDIDDDDDLEPEDDSGDELFDDEDTTASGNGEQAADLGLDAISDTGTKGDAVETDPKTEERLNKVENMSTDEPVDIEVNLMDVVTERPTPDAGPESAPSAPAIAFVYLGDSMHVALGSAIVASLTPELAGDNAELMHQKSFQLAVKHSIDTLGLKEALKNYNFALAKVRIPVGPQIAKLVKAGVAKEQSKVTAQLDDVAVDFQQALDIAVAGYAQNYFRNRTSPVKAALVSELVAAGLKSGSAERLVDRVFASHGVADLRTVLEIAREVAAKPVEARNGLAEAVNLMKYLPFQVKAEDESDDTDAGEDEDEDDDNEEATVATVAKSVSVNQSQTQVTATYRSPELQGIMGGKPFSSF